MLSALREFLAGRASRGVQAAVTMALVTSFATPVLAQPWPTKPVRIVVPAAPGGSADPLARLIAEELGKAVGQPVVVENRPGANGNLGGSLVAKSPADGYTLLMGWTGSVVSAVTLYDAKPFHPLKDFDPVVLVGSIPNAIVVNPSIPAKNLKELTEHAKLNPGKLNFGSTGSGSSYHLSGELYKKTFGVFMVHVPYTSPGAVFTDLLGGRLQLAFPGVAAAAPFVKDDRLRALAVMSDKRSVAMPNVPTTKELGFAALASETWFGLLAPKGTPSEVTQRINSALNGALNTPAFKEKIEQMGYTPLGGSPDRFVAAIKDDIVKWGEVVKFSGAKVD
ncbi:MULTISPECIES: Bug family tripartite tricarboxylate transporter substrate binding protein [unclassified Variovorax]|uniref:Bug family tripartite tricarboxylate transporter substrate binding protein n=1 Tax=unclassified Variovorax TaxID=663243 RepID=UPI003F48FAE0